jgi:hypothetical protein
LLVTVSSTVAVVLALEPTARRDAHRLDDGAAVLVDAGRDLQHAELREHPTLLEGPFVEVAGAAVDVVKSGRYLAGPFDARVLFTSIWSPSSQIKTCVAQSHRERQVGVVHHVAVLTVDRDEVLRSHQLVEGAQLALTGVARGVHRLVSPSGSPRPRRGAGRR